MGLHYQHRNISRERKEYRDEIPGPGICSSFCRELQVLLGACTVDSLTKSYTCLHTHAQRSPT